MTARNTGSPAALTHADTPNDGPAPPQAAADPFGLTIPVVVAEYNALLLEQRRIRARLAALTPKVTAFVTSLPAQEWNLGDGKIKVTTCNTPCTITRAFLSEAIRDMIDAQQTSRSDGATQTDDEKKRTCLNIVNFIWQRRTIRHDTKLQRTWSVARKRKRHPHDGNLMDTLFQGKK